MNRFIFRPSAERPAADAPGIAPGFRFYASDSGEVSEVVLNTTTGLPEWSSVSLPAVDNIIYVSPTGSATASGADSSNPTTLDVALVRWNESYQQRAIIEMAAGTYTAPTFLSGPSIPSGGQGSAALIRCQTFEDSGLGTRTLSLYTAGSTPVFATLTDSGGGLTVNAWRGYYVRFLTGSLTGRRYQIASNTAPVLTMTTFSMTGAVPGDTYVIERPAAVLAISGTNTLTISAGGGLGVFGVRVTGGAGSTLRFVAGNLYMDCCHVTGAMAVSQAANSGIATGLRLSVFPAFAADYLVTSGNYFATTGLWSMSGAGSTLSFTGSVISAVRFTCGTGAAAVSVANTYMLGSGITVDSSMSLFVTNSRIDGVIGSMNTALYVRGMSAAVVAAVDFSNITLGSAIAIENSYGRLSSIPAGTGNTSVTPAVQVINQSGVLATGAGSTLLLVTTGGAVKVGANAAEATWANIAADTAANISDLAAAKPQLCRCTIA